MTYVNILNSNMLQKKIVKNFLQKTQSKSKNCNNKKKYKPLLLIFL